MVTKALEHLKQTKGFESNRQELFLLLLRVVENLTYGLERKLEEQGVTMTQYNALRILKGAGEEGLPCREVGNRMVKRVPDVTRLLDRLEKQELITRKRVETNRRIVMSKITPKGEELIQRLNPMTESFHNHSFANFNDGEVEQLIHLLDRFPVDE
ncbi:MAG: MarR family winged helix-turn-helix transcriptional regulator [Sumerlaeia bacterium]